MGITRWAAHSIAGLLVLFVITVLAVYKPRGMTRHGWRKKHQPSSGSPTAT